MAKILIVDDDLHLLRMVGMILERGSHLPLLESDPLKAVARIRDERPGLVIVDVMMPELSGHDLTAQIRAQEDIAATPILVVSARTQSVDREAALASGADAYLGKPLLPGDLMEAIDRLLEQRDVDAAGGPPGSIVSFFSMRGGVGRTTLAVNLAAALRRLGKQEVCLVELSGSGGQAVLHLRLKTRASWHDLPPLAELDWPALKQGMLMHQSGLRVLAAPREPQPLPAFSAGQLHALLAILRRKARFTVLDLPPYLSAAVQGALAQTDIMFHVVAPEVVSVQTARHAMQQLAALPSQPREKATLLNCTTPEAQLAPQAVENALRVQLAFQIDYDPNQSRALLQGAPLALLPAASPIPEVTRRLANALLHRSAASASAGGGR